MVGVKHPVSKLRTALEQTGFTSMLNIRLAFSRTNTDISVRFVSFPLIIPHYSIVRDLLFPLPIFALERFQFLSLPILYTCICSFNLHSAVAACGNPIVYDLHFCDFVLEPNSSLCPYPRFSLWVGLLF
jgi:hypothetical protein